MEHVDIDALADKVAERVAERIVDRPLYSPNTLAVKLELTPRTVRQMLADGVIPSFVVGQTARRIDPAEVDAYLERRKGASGGRPAPAERLP
jgi:excisionase family DNA binding protein